MAYLSFCVRPVLSSVRTRGFMFVCTRLGYRLVFFFFLTCPYTKQVRVKVIGPAVAVSDVYFHAEFRRREPWGDTRPLTQPTSKDKLVPTYYRLRKRNVFFFIKNNEGSTVFISDQMYNLIYVAFTLYFYYVFNSQMF